VRYELKDKPDFSIVHVDFEAPGEQILVEASAMVARNSGVAMKTEMKGGLLAAAKRKMLGGESLFQNTFTSSQAGQDLWLAPGPQGDIEVLELDGSYPVMLSSGAFLAKCQHRYKVGRHARLLQRPRPLPAQGRRHGTAVLCELRWDPHRGCRKQWIHL